MASNPANQWANLIKQNGPEGTPWVPSSYQFFRMLTNSAETSIEMAGVDVVSGTQQNFAVEADSGHHVAIFRVNLSMFDASISEDGFGGMSALPIGLMFQHLGSQVGSREMITNYTPEPIKRTGDFTWLAGPDGDAATELGQGEDHHALRWTLTKGGAHCFLAAGEQFALCLQDSTTGLTSYTGMVQGIQYPDQ